MTTILGHDQLLERRRDNFRQRPDRAVRSLEEAARFIDEVVFALLFPPDWTATFHVGEIEGRSPQRGTLLPSLWEAHVGGHEPLVEWDEHASRVWHWRDELSEAGRAFYGKYLAGRASFVSPAMMSLFIAAGGGIPDEADLEEEYRQGNLRRELLVAYRAIREQGPIGSVALRRACGLGGSKLTREAEELERRFLVVRLGSRREGRRQWPSNVYDLLSRAYPSVTAEAVEYDAREASHQVAERYLRAAVFAAPADLSAALGWPLTQAEVALGDLVAARRARAAPREAGLPPGTVVSMLEARASSLEHRASKP